MQITDRVSSLALSHNKWVVGICLYYSISAYQFFNWILRAALLFWSPKGSYQYIINSWNFDTTKTLFKGSIFTQKARKNHCTQSIKLSSKKNKKTVPVCGDGGLRSWQVKWKHRHTERTFDNAKSWECTPFWSRLKFGPSRSIKATKHQNDCDSSPITYNIGERRSLIPYKSRIKEFNKKLSTKKEKELAPSRKQHTGAQRHQQHRSIIESMIPPVSSTKNWIL